MRARFPLVFDAALVAAALLLTQNLVTAGPLPASVLNDAAVTDLGTKNEKVLAAIDEFREGRDGPALELLEQAVASEPTLPPAKIMMARMLLASRRLPEGRRLLEEVAQRTPGNLDVYDLFGNIALAEGRVSDALLNFEKLRQLEAKSSMPEELSRKFRVRALAGIATVAEARRDWPAGERALRDWLTVEESPAALTRLARVRCLQGDAAGALVELKRAWKLDPEIDPPETALGWLLAEAGERDEALAQFRSATQSYPNDQRAWFGLANWLLGQERTDEAQVAISHARSAAPESRRVRFLAAVIARLRGDADAARELLDTLVEEQPNDFGPVNQLALLLASHSQRDQRGRALQLAEQNLRLHGAGSETLTTLGWVHLKARRYREANMALQKAVSGGVLPAEAAYCLARLNLEQGDRAEGVRLLNAALKAPVGQFFSRNEARSLLAELQAADESAPDASADRAGEAISKPTNAAPKPLAAEKQPVEARSKSEEATKTRMNPASDAGRPKK